MLVSATGVAYLETQDVNRTLTRSAEMYRWHATSNPQHALLGSAVRVLGTSFVRRDEQISKPDSREAP
jgi:hypothetical protein